MTWKDTAKRALNAVKPTTVSAEDKKLANEYAAKEARNAAAAKASKSAADAKAKKLTWSPVTANARTRKRASE